MARKIRGWKRSGGGWLSPCEKWFAYYCRGKYELWRMEEGGFLIFTFTFTLRQAQIVAEERS